MDKQEDKGGVLLKDKEYVKYVQLLQKAEREGRLDGTFNCRLCGMKYNTVEEAKGCCSVTLS